jgi:hypothetical protein
LVQPEEAFVFAFQPSDGYFWAGARRLVDAKRSVLKPNPNTSGRFQKKFSTASVDINRHHNGTFPFPPNVTLAMSSARPDGLIVLFSCRRSAILSMDGLMNTFSLKQPLIPQVQQDN